MEVLLKVCAAVLCISMVNCIPIIQQCQPELLTNAATVVGTTIIDNSVSNALANTLQLLIVSNLIENTINTPGSCVPNVLPAIAALSETIPIRASMYPTAYDVLVPEFPSIPYNPIPSFDIIAPREQIEIVPNIYYPEILPNPPCSCYDNLVPEFGYNIAPNCGCGIPNGPNLANVIPTLPNIGCGRNNFAYESYPYICDKCAPTVSEVVLPASIPAPYNYGYGLPNFGVNVDPWGYY